MSVFLSYARADDEQFAKRLHGDLTREGIDVWWDRERMPGRGEEFSEELRNAIDSADRLILVIGPSAVESRVVEQEWRYALSKCKVINPILRLGSYKLLPGRLAKLDVPDFRDDREYDSRLRYLIRQLKQLVGPLAPLHDIPKGQEWYINRQTDVDNAVAVLLDDSFRPAIGRFAKTAALQGMPGIGKSAIAAMVAEDCSIRRRFSDGVFWVVMGKTPSINTGMAKIGVAFGDDWQEYPDEERSKERLGQLLADKSVLVVLDDVWAPEPAEAFAQTLGFRCAVVVTTRQKLELANLTIEQLTDVQGLQLINLRLGSSSDVATPSSLAQQETYRKIVHLLRGHIQAISLAAAQLAHRGADFALRLLERLQQHLESDSPLKDLELPDHEERQFNMEASFFASYEDLSDDMKRRFRALGVFARGETFETQAAAAVWNDGSADVEIAEDALDYFVDAALLNRDAERRYIQHDLLHAYARALLEPAGEIEEVYQRHFVYFSGKYDKAGLETSIRERQALIMQDLANIREALIWSFRELKQQDIYTWKGVHLFRVVSEELTRSQLLDQLRSLLNDSAQYCLPNKQSELWPVYYRARLAEIEGQREPT